jgi:hypothetical protein
MTETATKLWRKGHPRAVVEASACKFLGVAPVVNPNESLRPSRAAPHILAPHEGADNGAPPFTLTILYPKVPKIGLICANKELLGMTWETLPIAVRPTTVALEVTLDICRLCPFWEQEAKQ